MSSPVAENLRRAADIIRERGWVRGDYEDPDTGAVCAMGALRIADGYRPDDYGHGTITNSAVAEVLANRKLSMSVIDFNDFVANGPEDVLALFEEAAALAEAGLA